MYIFEKSAHILARRPDHRARARTSSNKAKIGAKVFVFAKGRALATLCRFLFFASVKWTHIHYDTTLMLCVEMHVAGSGKV